MMTIAEITHKIILDQENDEYSKMVKFFLQVQTDEYLLKNDVLYKIIDGQVVLVVPEMMQVEIVKKKSHNLGPSLRLKK